jgi:hypothetical protein
MDTGATIHMTHNSGNISSSVHNSMPNSIIVGNGFHMPVHATDHSTLKPPYPPLHLNNILYTPKLIRNLISVRRLTTNNNVSIEFDPFGFVVKDYQTWIPIIRCDSTEDLYSLSPSTTQVTTLPHLLLYLRIYGVVVSAIQDPHLYIFCTKTILFNSVDRFDNKHVCQSCVFGKHVRLPFYDSLSVTHLPYDIIHDDLWTSPVPSSGGHLYYILFLDDYTNY